MNFNRTTAALTVSLATVALLNGNAVPAAYAQIQGQAWQTYHDPKFRVSLEYPPGWDVHVDAHAIVVRSGDGSEFALVENFTPKTDDTPEDYVDSLPSTESQYFRSAHVDNAYTEPAKSGNEKEEAGVGTLTFSGSRGPGQARVLARIFPSGGLLFAVASPRGQLASASPTLVHIIQSINFASPAVRAAETNIHSGADGAGTVAAATPLGLDPLANIKYKHWADPKEGAFSYDVPTGWKVDGATYRYEPLDYRQSVLVRSPHDEMAVMIGDPALPTFTLPSPAWTRLGYRDGAVQNVVGKPRFFMHYMTAGEFNQWYIDNILSKSVDDLQPGPTTDHQDIAEVLMAQARKQPGLHGQVVDSAATTTFTGRSKINGRRMAGNLISFTNEFIGNAQGDGNWTAHPSIVVYAVGDSKAAARKETAAAILKHMNQSFRLSQEWIADQTNQANSFLRANQMATNNAIAMGQASMQSMSRSHQAYMSAQDDRRASLMGSFKAQMAAKDENRRKELNYIGDTTDVANGSGTSWKVPSGYSNYYHNAKTGTIVGTNDPSNPGPDFSPLTQH